MLYESSSSASVAQANCEADGGTLAKVDDEFSSAVVRRLVPDGDTAWFGLVSGKFFFLAFYFTPKTGIIGTKTGIIGTKTSSYSIWPNWEGFISSGMCIYTTEKKFMKYSNVYGLIFEM